jgi:pimeloyl-ACP methyl ester carboxylesterase
MSSRELEANGLRFSCRETGSGGEPVLLLHGFPETSRMWDPLMASLADGGFHCLAPDQRGYNAGARPTAVEAYGYEELAGDVLAIALNWYRASRAHRRALEGQPFAFRAVDTPTMLIWGRDDPYVRRLSVDLGAEYMTGPYRVVELDAGHWLVQEQPDSVMAAVVEHLSDYRVQ